MMKARTAQVLALLISGLLSACSQIEEIKFNLTGTWCGVTGDNYHCEIWNPKIDSYVGLGTTVGKERMDTVSTELMVIEFENNMLFYNVWVNKSIRKVSFLVTDQNENGFTCENEANDFPQKITYRKSQDSLNIVISKIDGSNPVYYNLLRQPLN
jgi:hypothetical protein